MKLSDVPAQCACNTKLSPPRQRLPAVQECRSVDEVHNEPVTEVRIPGLRYGNASVRTDVKHGFQLCRISKLHDQLGGDLVRSAIAPILGEFTETIIPRDSLR